MDGGQGLPDDTEMAALPVSGGARDAILSAMPVVAIVLLVTLVGALLYVLDREETERARTQLISDALWVEQTLRFQLATDEDAVSRLALDAGRHDLAATTVLDRARVHVSNNPEVLSIAWFTGAGELVGMVPDLPAGTTMPDAVTRVLGMTRFSVRPIYGDLRTVSDGSFVVDMAAAVGPGKGAIVTTISLTALIMRHVPWWIAEKYAVRLVDASGGLKVEKSRVEPLKGVEHTISFDPPLAGLSLVIAPYKMASEFSSNMLIAAILGLAFLAVLSLLVLQRHVARRRRAEQRLKAETAFRRSMEESLTIGMRARDHEGRILYVNAAFARMVGLAVEDLIGLKPPMPYWCEDRLAETIRRHEALARSVPQPQSFETRFRRADGNEFDVLVYEAPLVDGAGQHRGWMGSIIDITDRKAAAELARLQAESLARTGRLVTLGEMASTLAHELNQPLGAIASYAAGSLNLLDQTPQSRAREDVTAALKKLAVQADRAGQIIRRIQDFVRKREPRFAALAIGPVIEETLAFVRSDLANARVRIETRIDLGLPALTADRILIEQLLINLVRNGAEAMAHEPEEHRILSISAFCEAEMLVISVTDRGPGIEEGLAPRLFEAFVSTKAEGMGMGLNICRSIVELHQGKLSHAPHDGGGTVFTAQLPLQLSLADREALPT
ncbi:Sensor protein FixL [Hartmannibacter diazotrophicus]|uniref:histidine kinase n=1 Tax=Hartmannibacter diazotrophicus TaxID=1482074 RepID=A0A2C9DC94_9HYPH|nr:PAS domain S-box protein [Hartmannibacter diazotrophicus]SON57799.1 Sensor protein FixL [Hartmannibacter diazotrophicus]